VGREAHLDGSDSTICTDPSHPSFSASGDATSQERQSMAWLPGTPVLWRSVRDGVVDVVSACRVVRDDDLVALYLCPGSIGRRGGPTGRILLPDGWDGGYEETVWRTHRALFLNRPGDAHSVGLFWHEGTGELRYWYVNLERPWRRTSLGFDTWDQVLDVVAAPDLSSWSWKDEDEFAWFQEVGVIGPDEAAAIRAEGLRAIEAIERRASPYRDGWETWTPDPTWTPIVELPKGWESPLLD
jgi:hypothetical protein